MTRTQLANRNTSNGKSFGNSLSFPMTMSFDSIFLQQLHSVDRPCSGNLDNDNSFFSLTSSNMNSFKSFVQTLPSSGPFSGNLSSFNFLNSSYLTNFKSLDNCLAGTLLNASHLFSVKRSAEKNDIQERTNTPPNNETNNKYMAEYTAALSAPYTQSAPKSVVRETPTRKLNKVKHQQSKKPRRVIPENKEYIPEPEPTDLDVVGGRGGVSTHHGGNRRYWEEILASRRAYRACGDNHKEKTQIARSVVDFINNNGGRFIQKEKATKQFYVLPHKVTMDKVKQALRDEYVPLWAR